MVSPGALGPLGAPGIRVAPPETVRLLTGVRRDGAAFAGVAPRGPARLPFAPLAPDTDLAAWLAGPRARTVPVPVTSWEEYRERFGGFEGPGRLPYAVSAFFAQGGARAWVLRIVHDYGDPDADAAGRAGGRLGSLTTVAGDGVRLAARDEGSWGNALRVAVAFTARPVAVTDADADELLVAADQWIPGGSVLRARLPGDVLQLRYVDRSELRPDPAGPGRHRRLSLDRPLSVTPVGVELVLATVTVTDTDPARPRSETVADVGLRADHPRWLARSLAEESAFVWPEGPWVAGTVALPDPMLPPVTLRGDGDVPHMTGGSDRWQDVVPEDFWDARWVPGDECPGGGVQCLGEDGDVGLLVAPDLYDPAPLAPRDLVTDPPAFAGPWFERCVEPVPAAPPTPRPPGLDGLSLEPRLPSDLARIVLNQQGLVAFADQRRDLTVLLDVPLGLPQRRVLEWRNAFDSAYAAAYHPWLDVAAPDDGRDALVRVNPSAFAAGVIAERETRLGVQRGPFNELAVGPVRTFPPVSPAEHDELHPVGLNLFRPERDGVRLTGGRTLSRLPALRQLNVARLMVVLRLSLEREMDWAVFEPNGEALWAEVRRMVDGLLGRLFEAGAFTGATREESYFVRCDRTTMTRNDLDQGRMVCLVGVAPAEPLEYLVLQLARDRDTSVRVETGAGAAFGVR